MFINRKDAGEKLSTALSGYRNKNVLVLGIPRGGAEIAYYIARYLKAELALIITRKLGFPSDPETAFGAIAEDGSVYLSPEASNVPDDAMRAIIEHEKQEIKRRIKKLRKGRPLPELKGRTVILADDGIATGSTLFAAIAFCRKMKVGKIVVAAPIAGQRIDYMLIKMVDEVIILEKPEFFYAVGQGYQDFDDLSDEETVALIDNWELERMKRAS
jgi:putative phosphoribosyl transferase